MKFIINHIHISKQLWNKILLIILPIEINNENSLQIIYDLLINNIVTKQFDDPIIYLYYGIYYQINENYSQMIKYYLTASNKGNVDGLYKLGKYYMKIEEAEHIAIKYFLMATEKGHIKAINRLGYYYQQIGDYYTMIKYYLMAIDKGHIKSMFQMGLYYQDNKDYDKMKHYYLMAIEKGHSKSLHNLAVYYESIKDYDNMIVYYLMAINRGNINSLTNIASYYKMIGDNDNMTKYYLRLIKLNNGKYLNEQLLQQYKNDLNKLVTYIENEAIINYNKNKYYQLVIKNIAIGVREFRFRYNSMTYQILKYNFQLNNGTSELELYKQLLINNKDLLNYLNINDPNEFKIKINEHIKEWC